jgi:hypothetical protein
LTLLQPEGFADQSFERVASDRMWDRPFTDNNSQAGKTSLVGQRVHDEMAASSRRFRSQKRPKIALRT